MRINHNIAALNTHRQLTNNTAGASKSLEKLSSGFRINRAGDDAAGLAISEKMRGQIRGLEMAMKNSQDSISLIQTAEGAMNEVHSILQRMRELAVQAVNDTNTEQDRMELQKEVNQLTSEINRIGNTTEFNEKKLLNGSLSASAFATSGSTVTTSGFSQLLAKAGTTVKVGEEPVSWSGIGSGGSQVSFDVTFGATADNGFDWAALASGGDNNLTVTKTASGFTVDFDGEDASGRTLVINADQLSYNPASGGSYSYNNHGINFSFTADEVANWTVGATVTFDLETVNGGDVTGSGGINSIPNSVDFVTNNATSGAKISGGIQVTGSGLLANATQVNISWTAAGDEIVVQLQNAAGSGLSTTTFSWTGSGAFNYAANGIKFTIEAGDATTLSGTWEFETETVATSGTTTTTSGTTTDNSLIFQTGSNENQTTTLAVEDVRSVALGISQKVASGVTPASGFSAAANVTNGTNGTSVEYALDITTSANAAKAITVINDAIKAVSEERSKLGAVQNRLEHTINNLGTSAENLTAAESRIRDVDMAKEMMAFTKDNILTQAAQAMLAQANQQPQGVLQLLR
jgi:flagellin